MSFLTTSVCALKTKGQPNLLAQACHPSYWRDSGRRTPSCVKQKMKKKTENEHMRQSCVKTPGVSRESKPRPLTHAGKSWPRRDDPHSRGLPHSMWEGAVCHPSKKRGRDGGKRDVSRGRAPSRCSIAVVLRTRRLPHNVGF